MTAVRSNHPQLPSPLVPALWGAPRAPRASAAPAILILMLLALGSGTALAQGRLIGRPCAPTPPPRCGPAESCAIPNPCGPTLVRLTSDVKIALADRVLRYEVSEVFRNTGHSVAEADYIFPLPPGAAFEDLKLSINGELVAGETMTADKARGIYEEIVRRQRDPALVEWMGSGMLRARIFPIAPGEEKRVVVRYQSVAEREGDALRIDYRRGTDPNGSGVATPVPQGREEEGGEWSRVRFLYTPSAAYGDPYSPTHLLRTRDEGRVRQVEARGSAREMTILLPLRRANAAALSVLAHAPERGERGFALITVTPPAARGRTVPRDLTFVVDVSGSMKGRKLEQAKAAGRALLETLRPDDRFRLIDFSTDVRTFRDGWSAGTTDNLAAARRYLQELSAEGSTNIAGALQEALRGAPTRDERGRDERWSDERWSDERRTDERRTEERRRDEPGRGERLPLVVFVTDGEPTVGERNADRIAELAARQRGAVRLFPVGVSAEVNATLIEQLAVEGKGTAHFVRDSESVERAVGLLATRLSTPVLTNVRLTTDGVRLSQVLPSGAMDVFAGQDLVMLARYDGSGDATLQLEGESADGPVRWTTRATFPDRTRDNPFVARLWAAQRVGWLAAEKRKRGGTSEMDAEIRSLGERYGIPTEFSSYLVVEPGMQVANAPTRRLGGQPLALDQVTVTGASTTASTTTRGRADARGREGASTTAPAPGAVATAPAAPPLRANEARFEAAKAAAEQRDLKSVAEMDALSNERGQGVRQLGARRFSLVNGVWMDARYTSSLRLVTVKPFSPAYFALLQRFPELVEPFALGERVTVAGRAVAMAVAPDGVETLTAAMLDALARDW